MRMISTLAALALALVLVAGGGPNGTSSSREASDSSRPEADASVLTADASDAATDGIGVASSLRTIVIDAGHGGADFGARGASGRLEKAVTLGVARRLGAALERAGFRVVHTRRNDAFVTLAERTEIANRAGADLFLSVHANSAPDPEAQGFETYFLSIDASDEEALRVATAENDVFAAEGSAIDSADIVGGILGDIIRTENLRTSSEVASAIQRRLRELPGSSRGVKQAPFVVLMGVNMPAVLVETGFLTNPTEEHRLGTREHQDAIAGAVASALGEFGGDADASKEDE